MPDKSSLPALETPAVPTLTATDVYKSVLKEYPDVLSVPQVAEILGVSVKTTYRLLNDGTIKSLKVGREFKVPKVFVLSYLKLIDHNAKLD